MWSSSMSLGSYTSQHTKHLPPCSCHTTHLRLLLGRAVTVLCPDHLLGGLGLMRLASNVLSVVVFSSLIVSILPYLAFVVAAIT